MTEISAQRSVQGTNIADWLFNFNARQFAFEAWRRRIVLGGIAATLFVLSSIYLLVATPQYEAHAVVVPNIPSSQVASSLAASLASSFTQGYQSTPDFANFQQLLTSEDVAKGIMQKHPEFLPQIFPKEWDPETKTWHPPDGIVSTPLRWLFEVYGYSNWTPPNPYRISQYINKNVTVDQLGLNPIYNIAFDHQDPTFARNFVSALADVADGILRRSQKTILIAQADHLNYEITHTNILAYQQALVSQLVQTQTQLATMGDQFPYAAKLLQPPTVSPFPTWPNVIIVLLGALFLTIILSVTYTLFVVTRPKRTAR